MGSIAGNSWESIHNGLELRSKHRALEFDYRPFGGESIEEFRERVLNSLNEIKDKHETREALIITHGGIVRLLTMLEKGVPLEETQNLSLYTFDLDKILRIV